MKDIEFYEEISERPKAQLTSYLANEPGTSLTTSGHHIGWGTHREVCCRVVMHRCSAGDAPPIPRLLPQRFSQSPKLSPLQPQGSPSAGHSRGAWPCDHGDCLKSIRVSVSNTCRIRICEAVESELNLPLDVSAWTQDDLKDPKKLYEMTVLLNAQREIAEKILDAQWETQWRQKKLNEMLEKKVQPYIENAGKVGLSQPIIMHPPEEKKYFTVGTDTDDLF
ncbi:hypothetical protein Cgig2_015416 [Carnegiea gigantea]|uniref:Uncharacterized protein n=1 Tax=Carnegiea gigantea TaxID=171969 RepID=A0A9Q1K330_9CARY|nr:hypothetical protein Cgig2_015416 [Carnegiea gigantea]